MASTINAKNTSTGVVITSDASGQLELQTADTTRMTIDVNGNVGIGTSSPSASYKLTVNQNDGGIAITAPSTKYALLSIAGNGNTLASTSFDILQDSTTAYIYNRANTPMVFATNSTERMRIDSSGNVLVGTTTQLAGTSFANFSTGNGWVMGIRNTANSSGINITNGSGTAGYTAIGFYNNGLTYSSTGTITVSGITTAYTSVSDHRLKENVQPMVGALDTVTQLKPVTYNWKADGSEGQGFIAHELQAVVPDCVTGEKDAVDEEGNPVYQGIDTSFLVATLTAAIQELKAIIDTQAERIAVLENK